MRPDLKMMLRGAGKFVLVALAAGIGGAAIGIGLAELTGDDASTPTATTAAATGSPAVTSATTETATTPPATTTTTAPASGPMLVPRVEIQSAQLSVPDATGQATVTADVRVTNRRRSPLQPKTPVLISEGDEVPLDSAGRAAAGGLLKTLQPGAKASGTLRFTPPAAVSRRLAATPRAQLRIAGRTVALRLKAASG